MESQSGKPESGGDAASALATLERARAAAQIESVAEMSAGVPACLATAVTSIVAASYSGPLGDSAWVTPALVIATVGSAFVPRRNRQFVPRPNRQAQLLSAVVATGICFGIAFCWMLIQALTAPSGIFAWIELLIGWIVVFGFFTWVRSCDSRGRLRKAAHVTA